jgi:membrane protein CcdC involved in cytochrome C biogenesis
MKINRESLVFSMMYNLLFSSRLTIVCMADYFSTGPSLININNLWLRVTIKKYLNSSINFKEFTAIKCILNYARRKS